MSKFRLRANRASGSERQKLEVLLRRGWTPNCGLSISDVLKRKTKKQRRPLPTLEAAWGE